MGSQSIVLGYIKEPYIHNRYNLLIQNHNRAKIFSLGRMDIFPPLNSTFFSETGESETYSNSLIYFAGTFKEIESYWETWLIKFETLLKTLVWESVYLSLNAPYYGKFEYNWKATEDIIATFDREFPQNVTNWEFTGGPRSFSD
ncbi:MAG TPA: hypothetical protein VEX64_05965 [Pyrinomonadaceae bacterium]|nr:hypothetical protein [Pyrinomonadaceae bacterium]